MNLGRQFINWFVVLILVPTFRFKVAGNDEDLGGGNQELVLPKFYSNLKIPFGKKTLNSPAFGLPKQFPALPARSDTTTPSYDEENYNSKEIGPNSYSSTTRSNDGGGGVYFPFAEEAEGSGKGSEPKSDNEPLNVDVNVQIQSIREIDELNEKIIVELDLTLHWKDYVLLPRKESYFPEYFENITELLKTYPDEQLSLELLAKLWKPDIIVERVVKITRPELLSIPITVRAIRETSSIIYTSRVSVKVDCTMNFEYYPADSQHCYLNLRSYQNDITKMNLRWNPQPGAYLVTTDSDDNFDVQLSKVESGKRRVKDINLDDAIFNVLRIKLSMRRKMTYHLVQTYIPSAFLVFITWLSFLVPEELIEARIGVSMTTLLTLTAMFSAVRESTPIVSYVKAIDIWMLYCIIIVFATLLEFTFFIWLRDYKKSQRERHILRKMDSHINPGHVVGETKNRNSASNSYSITCMTSKTIETFEKTSTFFNRFAFVVFVVIFGVFNIIYWPWLFVSAEYLNWNVNSTLNGLDDEDSYMPDEQRWDNYLK